MTRLLPEDETCAFQEGGEAVSGREKNSPEATGKGLACSEKGQKLGANVGERMRRGTT